MIDRMAEQNPWWDDPTAIERDRHLRRLSSSPFQRLPALLNDLDLESPSVYTVRGPRQVGKTTLVKQLIRQMLQRGTPPTRILYYSLDLEREPEAILAIVRHAKGLFPRSSSLPAGQADRWWLFFDEVSSVPDWQRAVKYLRDNTDVAEDTLVLTGSIATDVRRGTETMPGRRGPAARVDHLLLPLSFREFVASVDPALPPPPGELAPSQLSPPSEGVRSWLASSERFVGRLDLLLERYARVGGFPMAVRDHLTEPGGAVSDATAAQLWTMAAGDIVRLGRDPHVALKLLERVALSLGSPLSWNTLAPEIGVGAPHTAQEYVRQLAEAFLLVVVYAWDQEHATASLRQRKKLYGLDPLILGLPHRLAGLARPPDLPLLVENLVGMGLYRCCEQDLVADIGLPLRLHYWRTQSGNEVDFLAGRGRDQVPVEVKYQARVRLQDALAMRLGFGRGVLVSRTRLDLSGPIPMVPAGLFLWLLAE